MNEAIKLVLGRHFVLELSVFRNIGAVNCYLTYNSGSGFYNVDDDISIDVDTAKKMIETLTAFVEFESKKEVAK